MDQRLNTIKSEKEIIELEKQEDTQARINVATAKAKLQPAIDEVITETENFSHVVQALLHIVADISIEHVRYKGDPVKWAIYMANTFLKKRLGETYNQNGCTH